MEIQKILDKLQDFDLSEISIAPGPTHIHTHKMIKPGQARFSRPAFMWAMFPNSRLRLRMEGKPISSVSRTVICLPV